MYCLPVGTTRYHSSATQFAGGYSSVCWWVPPNVDSGYIVRHWVPPCVKARVHTLFASGYDHLTSYPLVRIVLPNSELLIVNIPVNVSMRSNWEFKILKSLNGLKWTIQRTTKFMRILRKNGLKVEQPTVDQILPLTR